MKIKIQQKNQDSRFIKVYSTRLKHSFLYSGGFTLIELMVATSIFVVIMLSSMGSLFSLLDSSKDARALRFAMDNVNFAMESMTRSIRMGSNYYCLVAPNSIASDAFLDEGLNCLSGGTFISFLPQEVTTERVGYKLTARNDAAGTHTLEKCSPTCVPIISPDINIEKLMFFVRGSSELNDELQASVYIIMKGTAYVKGVATSFAIQTLASQRNF